MLKLIPSLFARIIARNREVYLLKIITLAIAFASSILITLFTLQEVDYDRFHYNSDFVFRVLQKNTDEQYSGNRLSTRIPSGVFNHIKKEYRDSLVVSRVKILNGVTVRQGNTPLHDQKIHAADPEITTVFSVESAEGSIEDFNTPDGVTAMISARAAQKYFGKLPAVGRELTLYTFDDTIHVTVAAVFKDFPKNSHEDFDVFISFHEGTLEVLNFNAEEAGVYGRSLKEKPEDVRLMAIDALDVKRNYSLQPVSQIYFGPRVLHEEARHGDNYSVILLICITGLIFFLSLTSFINLTTITLPYRSKELAIKKLAGTNKTTLILDFLWESCSLVVVSLLIGLLIITVSSAFIESTLSLDVLSLMAEMNGAFVLTVVVLFIVLSASPVFMTWRFVSATPNRLLSTDTITFPRLKRIITFLQLGISIFLIITSVVVQRQINYSLVKEPGQNHDQIVYLNSPAGITNEGIVNLRTGWRKYNPNILDVMAVSQLPDRVSSKEIDSEYYMLQVDRGFRDFFELKMLEGHWFGPNSNDTDVIVNRSARALVPMDTVLGVVEEVSGYFNQPEKPMRIKLGEDYTYNWLCVRVLEVDIRRTVSQLSNQLSFRGEKAKVNYLSEHFESWIKYQDRLNMLSGILAIVAGVLSCFAIYGLSISLVRDKLKEIAVHRLLGADIVHVTYLLVREFTRQMLLALIIFGPLTYILLNELLRTFVYTTPLSWLDPVYPIAYCGLVIVAICGFQAMSLNRTDFSSALKGQ